MLSKIKGFAGNPVIMVKMVVLVIAAGFSGT